MGSQALRAALLLGSAVITAPVGRAIATAPDLRPPLDINASPVPGQVRPGQLRTRIYEAFDAGDPAAAAGLLEQYLEQFPQDGLMLYNAACAQVRLGEFEEAEALLRKAVGTGFVDCSLFRRDPDMAPLRERPALQAILAARDAADTLLAERSLEKWRTAHGDAYRVSVDRERRLNLVTALDEPVHVQLMLRVQRQADHLVDALFGLPLRHYVMVALAAETEAVQIFENPAVSGHYHHHGRRLVVADVNPSMPHELVHAYHNNHMDAIGQDHPIWIREGLATLYETYRFGDDGAIDYVTNDRDVLVASLAERDGLVAWKHLFRMDTRAFKFRADERYAQVRTIFEYLADRGKLRTWYDTYTERYGEDPTGALAFEVVFGRPLDEVEAAWRHWLDRRSLDETPIVLGMLPPPMPVIGPPKIAEPVGEDLALTELVKVPTPEALPGRPDEAARAYRRGRRAYANGDFAEAVARFLDVIAMLPDDADARYDLALAYVRLGDLAKARAEMRAIAALDSSLASLLANIVPLDDRATATDAADVAPSSQVLDPELRELMPDAAPPRATCTPERGCARRRRVRE